MERTMTTMTTPLADLHRHLDGSLRRETLEEFARREGREVPHDLLFVRGMGLDAALARFAFTLSLLQDAASVARVAREMCEDAERDGVTTLEIRFAPQLHLARGEKVEAIVDAAIEGANGRAGIILCGLYGEPLSVLGQLVDVARARRGVVGIDLAGGPSPKHGVELADYAPLFRRAADLGIGRTVHAAEGRPPREIRVAIESLLASRIGHGTTLLEDPSVVDLVVARGVTIEACATSNVHTGVIASVEAHPLAAWLSRGVRACVCTDNTLLSNVSAREEHARVAAIPGMTPELVDRAIGYGHAAAFSRS
jgi:adenosine deaminase